MDFLTEISAKLPAARVWGRSTTLAAVMAWLEQTDYIQNNFLLPYSTPSHPVATQGPPSAQAVAQRGSEVSAQSLHGLPDRGPSPVTSRQECGAVVPPWLQVQTLQEALSKCHEHIAPTAGVKAQRCPPSHRMAGTDYIQNNFLLPYSTPSRPVATQGPPVRKQWHRGQPVITSFISSGSCVWDSQVEYDTCSDHRIHLLRELRVGQPGSCVWDSQVECDTCSDHGIHLLRELRVGQPVITAFISSGSYVWDSQVDVTPAVIITFISSGSCVWDSQVECDTCSDHLIHLLRELRVGQPGSCVWDSQVECDTCSDHRIHLLRELRVGQPGQKGELAVAFLNLAKAFDTVSHDLVRKGMQRFRVPDFLVNVVADMYEGAKTTFTVKGGQTESITIGSGVKQGDPLSPILFDMALDPLLCLLETEVEPWKIGRTNLTAMGYADDTAVMSRSRAGLETNLELVDGFCQHVGLKLNVRKSFVFNPKSTGKTFTVNNCEQLSINGEPIPWVAPDEATKYLGKQFGPWVGLERPQLIEQLKLWDKRVRDAPLKPTQRLKIWRGTIVPRILSAMLGADAPKGYLRELDNIIREHVQQWRVHDGYKGLYKYVPYQRVHWAKWWRGSDRYKVSKMRFNDRDTGAHIEHLHSSKESPYQKTLEYLPGLQRKTMGVSGQVTVCLQVSDEVTLHDVGRLEQVLRAR
ncbi:hypothetical protein ACOMHN_022782 [Nucella lapillus]